jgi:hypothetical protein
MKITWWTLQIDNIAPSSVALSLEECQSLVNNVLAVVKTCCCHNHNRILYGYNPGKDDERRVVTFGFESRYPKHGKIKKLAMEKLLAMDVAKHSNFLECAALFDVDADEKVVSVTIPLFSYRVDCFWPNGCPDTCDRWHFIGFEEAKADLARLERFQILIHEQQPHLKKRTTMQIAMMEEECDDDE